jgi:hypothetical protein
MYVEQSSLEPSDIVVIAGHAGGIDPRTVDRYLRGLSVRRRKQVSIERALRELGMGAFVRPAA